MKKVGQMTNQLEEGDILKLVNGENPEDHSTVSLFNRIEMAESITIKGKDLKTKTFSIEYNNLVSQYVIYLLLPLLFSVTTISLSTFLFRKKERRSISHHINLLFINQ